MVNDSSLPVGGTLLFDLESSAGITQLLVSVRTSNLSAEQKNDIRDLVFQYTNGGRDATVRRALEQKIVAADLKPATPKVVTPPPPPPPLIGTFRSVPVFTPPAIVVTKVVTPEPTPIVNSEPVPVEVPVSKETVEAESLPAAEPVPVPKSAPLPPPPPIPEPPKSAPVTVQSLDDNQAYLNRIREIKTEVNERVGNPVHLVDINNEVGREYMSALLEAMKKLNSGSSAAQAMQRLEAAFAAVKVALDEHDTGEKMTPAYIPESVPEVTAESPVDNNDAKEPASFVAGPVSVTLPVTPVPPPVTPPQPPAPTIDTSAWSSVAPVTPVQPSTQVTPSAPTIDPSAWKPITPPSPNQRSVEKPVVGATGWNAVPTTPIASPLVHSIAEAPAPKTPDVLPLTRQPETAPVGDVLYTEEVDQGLEQLLLEWSLFKKSGLFGTGPKGREHPLFKKIAGLQIPLLLAGRFEGATQEIKQSITDYMNGWRYEQGIIYEPGELFEHYLRRVIRHILDLQKNKTR